MSTIDQERRATKRAAEQEDSMRAIERVVGITIGTILLAAAPSWAMPAGQSPTIGWRAAEAVAARRVAGDVLTTTPGTDAGRATYMVSVRTADNRLEQVEVDAHSAKVLGVHPVMMSSLIGETEAP
jgi:uncharacterized membrane protein YkoI